MAEKGHCKHEIENEEGQVCLVGAFRYAIEGVIIDTTDSRKYEPAFQMARQILKERGYVPPLTDPYGFERPDNYVQFSDPWLPIEYNNDPDVTGEDVILLLKETGARLEEAEEA